MNTYDKNKLSLYLTAVSNDFETYFNNPDEFTSEFFEDLAEAVNECLDILNKKDLTI